MKTLRLFFLLIAVLSIPLISTAQESQKFTRPHDFYTENSRIMSGPVSTSKTYAKLPSLYENVNLSNTSAPENEPSVKFSAKYPSHVLAAYRDFSMGINPAQRRIGYTYSEDSGRTWFPVNELIPALDPNHPLASDPSICSDTNGYFYVATISLTNAGGMDILVFRSTNHGSDFTSYSMAQGGNLANQEDKEWIACDLTKGSSPYKNHLYISWTRFGTPAGILLTKSSNGGVNWTPYVQVSSGGGVQGSNLAIGPNGEVYVVWLGITGPNYIVFFNKSTNGGASFGTEKNIAQGTIPNIQISSSGITFPSIAVDVSGGPRNGYVYVTFCDSRNGDPDVFLITSSNGGTNWSAPVRVNNDAVGNGKLQCWPWIALNEQGKMAIIYYDSRNGATNSYIEAWLARSTNGGQTFINAALSSVSFNAAWPNTDVRFGDYINIDYRGSRIVPVWTDLRNGGVDQEIYTAIVNVPVGVQNISTEIPVEYSLQQNYPNPFNPATKIKFSITENGKPKNDNGSITTLKVYDITGKEVAVLINERLQPGTYETSFDGSRLNSGVYFYRLNTGSVNRTKKMMLIK
jgi:hypothetical protein